MGIDRFRKGFKDKKRKRSEQSTDHQLELIRLRLTLPLITC